MHRYWHLQLLIHWSNSLVKFTGALHLFHGEERVGPVSCLAICRDPQMEGLLLFHCDEKWEVLAAQIWNSPDRPTATSIEEIEEMAEKYYSGISSKWMTYGA